MPWMPKEPFLWFNGLLSFCDEVGVKHCRTKSIETDWHFCGFWILKTTHHDAFHAKSCKEIFCEHINGRRDGTPKFGPQLHGVDNLLIVPKKIMLQCLNHGKNLTTCRLLHVPRGHRHSVNEKHLRCAFFMENVQHGLPVILLGKKENEKPGN